MYDYMIDKINENDMMDHKFDKQLRLKTYMSPIEHGIETRSFFFFKFTLEKDRRYAFENLNNFTNFDEFLPISYK